MTVKSSSAAGAKKRIRICLAAALCFAVALLVCACTGGNAPVSTTGPAATAEPTAGTDFVPPTAPTAEPTAAPTEAPVDDGLRHLSMLGMAQTGPRRSTEDLLTPIWREKTGIAMELTTIPAGMGYSEYVEYAVENGTLPDVIALEEGIFDVSERCRALTDAGALMAISWEDVQAYMPLTAARLEGMGVSLRDWYEANAAEDGLWYFVPQLPSPLFDRSVRSTRYGIDNTDLELTYLWVRDDVLKEIIPAACTASELEQFYYFAGDTLDIQYVLDWQVDSLGSLEGYFEAALDTSEQYSLGLVPAHPGVTGSAGSVSWSLYSLSGLMWNDTPEFVTNYPAGGSYFCEYALSPEWKGLLSWFNRCYEKGFFGADYFTVSAAARAARVSGGTYAVVSGWLAPPDGVSGITGDMYSWRLYPAFASSSESQNQASSVITLSLRTDGAVGFNSASFSQDDIAALLGWVDWNYSLEADTLRTWGVGMTQGEDAYHRRFTAEYAGVEAYMLSGTQSERDGWYYGLVNALLGTYECWNHEVYGVGGRRVSADAPFYVYPLKSIDFDQEYYVRYMTKRYLMEQVLRLEYAVAEPDAGKEARLDEALAGYKTAMASVAAGTGAALQNALTCGAAGFEGAYAEYAAVCASSGADGWAARFAEELAE